MYKKNLNQIREIRKLERKRARILASLLVAKPLMKGGLSLVKRTCGKPNCHCAKKPSHEAWVLSSRRDKKARCQVIRKADVAKVSRQVRLYREYREALRTLQAIGKEEKELLHGLMEDRNVGYE